MNKEEKGNDNKPKKKGKLSLKSWSGSESNENSSLILRKLNEDRTRSFYFCDFTIKTETHEFPVHKCLLGVMSDFFKNMFTSNMRETYEKCATLEGDAEIVSMVIEFIYNNPISVTMENVYDLLESADFLQISLLQRHCINFLTQNLSSESVLRSWEYAQSYNMDDLLRQCEKYLSNNLSSFINLKKHLNLHIETFEHFIRIKGNSTDEKIIYESIVEWVEYDKDNRQEYFSKLFALIDLNKLNKSYLNAEVSTNDLVLQCHESSKLLLKSMRSHLVEPETASVSNSAEQINNVKEQENSLSSAMENLDIPASPSYSGVTKVANNISSSKPKHSKATNSQKPGGSKSKNQQHSELLLVGGKTSPQIVRTYSVVTKKWNTILSGTNKNFHASIAILHRALYVVGGCDAESLNAFNKVECLVNIKSSKEWIDKAHMHYRRYKFGCATFRNQIYVAGGYIRKAGWLSSVESYNFQQNHWIKRSEMNFRRGGCQMVETRGVLFAIGGKDNFNSFHNSMEWSDGNNWKIAPSMIDPRCDFAAVSLVGFIYAIGGEARPSFFLNSVERFDPQVNVWIPVARLNIPRAEHCACAVAGKIYVVGGRNHKGPVSAMEVYDPNINLWEIVREIREDLSGAALVAL